MANRKPSQHSIDLYNQLVQRQNKVRNTLRRIHTEAEASKGAGRLPALVIPKKAHKLRQGHFEGRNKAILKMKIQAFWKNYRALREAFGGKDPLRKYIAKTVTRGYRDLFKDLIGIDPEANGLFSKSQIVHADETTAKYMQLYNKMFRYGNEMQFYKLLITGNIIEFKWFYREFMFGNENENLYVEEQLDIWNRANTPKAKQQLDEAVNKISPELSKELHKNDIIKKSERAMNRDIERAESEKKAMKEAQKAYLSDSMHHKPF